MAVSSLWFALKMASCASNEMHAANSACLRLPPTTQDGESCLSTVLDLGNNEPEWNAAETETNV